MEEGRCAVQGRTLGGWFRAMNGAGAMDRNRQTGETALHPSQQQNTMKNNNTMKLSKAFSGGCACRVVAVLATLLAWRVRGEEIVCRFTGAEGRKAAALMEERVFGAAAKGLIYEETVKAFRPVPPRKTNGAWLLTLSRGTEQAEIPVSDFASAADADDVDNRFSIWF